MPEENEGLDEHDSRVWEAYFEMQVLFWRRMSHDLQQETGLSEPDFAILTALRKAPGGRLRAYQLAGVTEFEKSRLHHHLTRMAARGLVAREQDPANSRGTLITLTDDGRTAIDRATPARARHIRKWLIDPLDRDRLDLLADVSARVTKRLRAN
ncbi:MarR family winged helix-turn-helix transcriptional regulator [Nonomuraea zeae]|uniref:Winged helix DNA-binding protein n=1 Tax=Nonomuraea zeae TaxID=1642303 RepID=A0A5S4GN59_9ACTN|nr:MarR family transcriptional regulator [Nonomuraea zeae]TMR34323.1 winged helix DNA-binding protein [Nonomuraea zeae]